MRQFLRKVNRYTNRQLFGDGVVNFKGKGVVNMIDVGSVGNLPHPWNKNTQKIQNLLKFEPRDTPGQNPHIVTVDTALWETNCKKDFYIYKGFRGSGSSLLPQNYEYVSENFEELRQRGPKHLADTWFERSQLDSIEKINCRTLDSLLQELLHPFSYHFLKIDAQGAEYQILVGAERFLQENCIALQLELFVVPLYKGIKLLLEVEAYLDSLDFELVKKFSAHGTFNSQHDCLFLKKDCSGKVVDTIKEVYNL